MAVTVTPNLKLRIDSNLTANAKYNLSRLDLLGATFLVDSTNSLNLRSQTNIVIEPNSADIGGSGVSGSVSIGTANHKITSLNIYATSFKVEGSLVLDNGTHTTTLAPAASGQTENLVFRLPNSNGTANATLTTDGAGNLNWGTALGTVTSVDLATPEEFTVSGGPVTTAGTLAFTKANQTANRVYAGPATGAAAQPSFRSLVFEDLPALTYETTWVPGDGNVKIVTHNFGTISLNVTLLDLTDNSSINASWMCISNNSISLTSSEIPSSSGWRVVVQR